MFFSSQCKSGEAVLWPAAIDRALADLKLCRKVVAR
jgi:hypothetical protein